ncbi:MAG TPA: YeeE/YedE family protein [Thermodesulfovibrionales bacterium]|nr:YeeE/YedE family protein [Thermodesulfovibrionales bacterium]
MPFGSGISALTAILLGTALGFVLQRGRFCLNSAFRDIIFIQDFTFFRAYLLCISVAIIGTNILESAGLIFTYDQEAGRFVSTELMRQNFVPIANVLGGFLFGLGIVLAGGCASGIVYRLGEGQIGAMIAIVGFFFGIGMTTDGMLSPVREYLKSFKVEIFGVSNPAIWDLFGGGPAAKWGTIAVFIIVMLAFVFKGKPSFGKSGKGYAWGLTGVFVGLLTIVAWEVSSVFGGTPRGLAITTPLRELFNSMLANSTHSPFREFSFIGIFTGTWGVFFILSVPFGAWISAVGLKEFKWKTPPAKEVITVLFGSILMGIGAVIAGGCNLGHGVTGMSTMSLASLVAIISIMLGNWVMVYFKFIKAME